MHIRIDPSFFLTNRTGAPQGELLGRMNLFLGVPPTVSTTLAFLEVPTDTELSLLAPPPEPNLYGMPLVSPEEYQAVPPGRHPEIR